VGEESSSMCEWAGLRKGVKGSKGDSSEVG
jgi:hypothetical protein